MTTDEPAVPFWRQPILIAAAAGTLMLFSFGVTAGVILGSLERGAMKPVAVAFLIGALILAVLSAWSLKRTIPAIFTEVSPSVGRARRMVVWSGAIGGVLGVVLVLGSMTVGSEPPSAFSNAPLPGWLAIAAIAMLLIVVPPVTWIWHRSIDEHEAQAYREGTLAGMYAFSAIAPTWWIGWRGGLWAEPDTMIIFFIVYAVWGLVWVVRRHG